MRIENLFNHKKNQDIGRQLNIDFVDLKKDKSGKTVYDFLKEAGVKESDSDYKKILNSLSMKDNLFYINNIYIKEYLYWRKVKNKDTKASDVNSSSLKNFGDKAQIKNVGKEKALSEKEQRRKDYMMGQYD